MVAIEVSGRFLNIAFMVEVSRSGSSFISRKNILAIVRTWVPLLSRNPPFPFWERRANSVYFRARRRPKISVALTIIAVSFSLLVDAMK